MNDYAIPRGDWFEYVSSPHYLAEIVSIFAINDLSCFSYWRSSLPYQFCRLLQLPHGGYLWRTCDCKRIFWYYNLVALCIRGMYVQEKNAQSVSSSYIKDVRFFISFIYFVLLQAANLTFAASETQKWYLRKFDNYPRNRCAIIPFVY